MVNNKYFSITYGFRSLIDWQATESFYRGGKPTDSPQFSLGEGRPGVGGGVQSAEPNEMSFNTSGLVGPSFFGAHGRGGKRPLEWQGASRTQIPFGGQSRGFYYGVRNEQPRPKISGKIDKEEDIFTAMNEYSQQWLYLAAEKLKMRAGIIEQRGDTPTLSPEEQRQHDKFSQSDDEGFQLMAQNMSPDTKIATSMMKGGNVLKSGKKKYFKDK